MSDMIVTDRFSPSFLFELVIGTKSLVLCKTQHAELLKNLVDLGIPNSTKRTKLVGGSCCYRMHSSFIVRLCTRNHPSHLTCTNNHPAFPIFLTSFFVREIVLHKKAPEIDILCAKPNGWPFCTIKVPGISWCVNGGKWDQQITQCFALLSLLIHLEFSGRKIGGRN
jgi:hypothetical protein